MTTNKQTNAQMNDCKPGFNQQQQQGCRGRLEMQHVSSLRCVSFFFRSYYTNILSCLIFLGFYIYDAPSMNDEMTNSGCRIANLLWASVGLSGHYCTSSICPPTPVYSLPLSPHRHRQWLGCRRGSLWRRFTHVHQVLLRTK